MKKTKMIITGVAAGLILPLSVAGCAGTDSAATDTQDQTTAAVETTTSAEVTTTAETTTAQGANAESQAEILRSVYDIYTDDDSEYSEYKELLQGYYDDVTFEEELSDEKITITINADDNEYVESGTWEFVQDGDYLTYKGKDDDITGIQLYDFLTKAVGEALGEDPVLFPSYIYGLRLGKADNNYISETSESDGTLFKIYDAGAYDMSDIDDMYITEEIAKENISEPSGDDSFTSIPIGKIRFVAHGLKDNMSVAIGEYGENTKKSYDSLVNALNVLKPEGYEAFLEAFDEFKVVEGEGFSSTTEPDDETKEYLGIEDEEGNFKYLVVTFGE